MIVTNSLIELINSFVNSLIQLINSSVNSLIQLISSFVNSLDTGEISIIIISIAFSIWILKYKGVREALCGVVKAFLTTKIIIPFIGMILYISLISLILYHLGILNIDLVKYVIFWFFPVAIPLFFTANRVVEDKNYFKTKAVEYVKITTLFSFFINFYTFNIFGELILQSILLFLILLIAVSKIDKKYKAVENLLSIILLIIVACLVIFFIYSLLKQPNELININTGIAFVLPGILTILLLPYIYLLALYMRYDLFYLLMKAQINDSKLNKYVFKEVFKRYNLNLYGLNDFLSQFVIFNIKNTKDVDKEILNAEKSVKSQNENIK